MAAMVYLLCALTSAACAGLLIRQYWRTRARLLLWSSAAFVGFALNNAIVFTDFVLAPQHDLAVIRALAGLASVSLLLYAFLGDGL